MGAAAAGRLSAVMVWLGLVVGGAAPGEDFAAGSWAGAGDGDACGRRFLLEGVAEAFLLAPPRKAARGKPLIPWDRTMKAMCVAPLGASFQELLTGQGDQ